MDTTIIPPTPSIEGIPPEIRKTILDLLVPKNLRTGAFDLKFINYTKTAVEDAEPTFTCAVHSRILLADGTEMSDEQLETVAGTTTIQLSKLPLDSNAVSTPAVRTSSSSLSSHHINQVQQQFLDPTTPGRKRKRKQKRKQQQKRQTLENSYSTSDLPQDDGPTLKSQVLDTAPPKPDTREAREAHRSRLAKRFVATLLALSVTSRKIRDQLLLRIGRLCVFTFSTVDDAVAFGRSYRSLAAAAMNLRILDHGTNAPFIASAWKEMFELWSCLRWFATSGFRLIHDLGTMQADWPQVEAAKVLNIMILLPESLSTIYTMPDQEHWRSKGWWTLDEAVQVCWAQENGRKKYWEPLQEQVTINLCDAVDKLTQECYRQAVIEMDQRRMMLAGNSAHEPLPQH